MRPMLRGLVPAGGDGSLRGWARPRDHPVRPPARARPATLKAVPRRADASGMQWSPLDGETGIGVLAVLPDLGAPPAPHLTLVDTSARRDHLPEDWTTVGPVIVAGRTLDRVVAGPNGVFAVTIDPDPRAAVLGPDGLYRGSQRVTGPVKLAVAVAFDLRRVLAEAGITVFPYAVLVARGADGMLGRLRVVSPGCLASAIWRHPGYPLRRSERARVLAAVQHPATA